MGSLIKSDSNFSVVVTSISSPNLALKKIAEGSLVRKCSFYVIGDRNSPLNFQLDGCRYVSLSEQKKLSLKLAQVAPENHYSRKNIGYLLAIKNGAQVIVETDDDNIPLKRFWSKRSQSQNVSQIDHGSWLNAYAFFIDRNIWPRGYPLEYLRNGSPSKRSGFLTKVNSPIQQGLANNNPDVDAVFRMTQKLPFTFNKASSIALGARTWCPFNSQNTTWFKDAFPLLYLPSYCSFRLTDIWRSFVAQRIAWTCGWNILFHDPTVYQERNEHNLLKDFKDEIDGYINNAQICKTLNKLELRDGTEYIFTNLRTCYEEMVKHGWISDIHELSLLDSWIEDITSLGL